MKVSEAVKYLVSQIDTTSRGSRDQACRTMRAIAACAECVLVEGDVDVGNCFVAGLSWGDERWAICTDDDISIDAPDEDDDDDDDDDDEDEDDRFPCLRDLPIAVRGPAVLAVADGQVQIAFQDDAELLAGHVFVLSPQDAVALAGMLDFVTGRHLPNGHIPSLSFPTCSYNPKASE